MKGRSRFGTLGTLAVAVAMAMMVLPGGLVMANHGTAALVNVGVDFDGSTGGNDYDISDNAVLAGTQVDFFFDNGFHNVLFASQPAGATLPDSPASPGGDTVGTTFSVTPTVAGEYRFYCSIHSGAGDTATTYDGNGMPNNGEMVGRIVVTADTTDPVWGAGSLTATPVSGSQIDLAWPAATDNSGSVSYEVYEGTAASPKPGAPVATVSGTSLSRTGLSAGVQYWYWITAVDGSGNAATPDQQANATTSLVNATATDAGTVQFDVSPTLSVSVSPTLLNLGSANPNAAATGTATVSVESNSAWSMSLKSIGRDGIDGSPGDDAVFDDNAGNTIPVGRMTWEYAGGGTTAVSDADAVVVTGQASTAGTDLDVDYSLQLQFSDPASTDYRTVIQYTVTQP